MRRIISRLSGGLGNQMFQYAFARSIQEKYGGKIIFDLHLFNYDEQFDLSLIHFKLENPSKNSTFETNNRLYKANEKSFFLRK